MTILPENQDGTWSPRVLARRVADLRAQEASHVFPALLGGEESGVPLEAIATALNLQLLRLQDLSTLRVSFDRLSFAECARRRCAVLLAKSGTQETGSRMQFLVTDPFDTNLLAWARTQFGVLDVALVSEATFDAWLVQCESNLTALDHQLPRTGDAGRVPISLDAEVLSLRDLGSHESPAVRFVNSTLYDALKVGASDIHLESHPGGIQVKFRLDGVLNAMARLDSTALAAQAISRIKVMAQLDIAERRVPQDGRLQIGYNGRSVDVRVSIMPSIHGEDAVLRILDRQHLAESLAGLTLANLGFDEKSADAIRLLCRKPHGMFLVTGPTGSGKTTTIYGAIAETHQSRDKIITIEDPVEYQLAGVLQIPVNEKKGLTFARGLRSILRHDPDKILVGEIRDAETAQIAVQSALTGHLVFTTVHANSVFDVVGRFEQFGIDAYMFASAINGVLAQRLLRRVCMHCAQPLTADELCGVSADLRMAVDQAGAGSHALLKAVGCERCRGTGYSGRFALGELLLLTPLVKAHIAARAPLAQTQAEAERGGWRSLRALAIEAAVHARTTPEEVERVAI